MPRTQKLLTSELRKVLPPLYANAKLENVDDAVVYVKLFSCYGSGGDWWITEFDGQDLLFGYADLGQGGEWGYISLSELQSLRVYRGQLQAVERDTCWTPKRWGDCRPKAPSEPMSFEQAYEANI